MHLSSLCTSSTRKLAQAPNSLFPTSRVQILTRFFCPALVSSALKFTAAIQQYPTISSVPLSSCFSDISIKSPLLSAAPYPSTWLHELSKRRSAALAWRLVEQSQPLAPAHCRDGERCPTSCPNDVAYTRASHLNHNLWPCSQMLRGFFMWLHKRRELLEWGGEGSRERSEESEQRHSEKEEWFFWGSFHRSVFLRNNDLTVKAFYLV